VVESIDSSKPWVNVPPRIAVADGAVFVHAIDRFDDIMVVLSRHAQSEDWTGRYMGLTRFDPGGDFATDEAGHPYGCLVTNGPSAGRLNSWSSSASGLESELVTEGARPSCSVVRNAEGRTDIFFGRRGELWHGWREGSDGWSFEPVGPASIWSNAVDSARGADGIHVSYSSFGHLFYALYVDNEWSVTRLGEGDQPVMDLDHAGRPHIVVIHGRQVEWWRQDADGVWGMERVYRCGHFAYLRHLSMAIGPEGTPVVAVHEGGESLPWSVRSTLVSKRDGEWQEEVLPWTECSSIAIDGQQRLHVVFADREGVKHAVR